MSGKRVPFPVHLRLLLIFLTILASISLLPTESSGQVEDAATAEVPPVTEVVLPTEPPVQAPTLEPAPTTAPQIPTEAPPVATEIPAPTATRIPPTPAPTATRIPTIPPTPAPTKTPTPGFSVQSVISGSGCTQVSSTDVVLVLIPVEFRCNGATGPGNSPVTRTFSNLTSGWEYQLDNGPWRSTVEPVLSQRDQIPAFTVRLRATALVALGSGGGITVSVQTTNGSGGAHTTRMGASVIGGIPPTAADLLLSCTPSTFSASAGESRTVACTYSARASMGSRQITLTRIVVPAPAGWTITGSEGTVAGSTLTITPNAPISYSATSPLTYAFSFTLTPGCTAATTNQTMNLTSAFSFSTTSGIAGAATTTQAARSTAATLAVAVQGSSLTWSQEFSLTDIMVSGDLVYRISANACSGWNIAVSASPFRYSGPYNGDTIPASNMTLTSTGTAVALEGSAAGVSPQAATGPMNSSRKVLSAAAGSGIGTYEQQLSFSLTIPGRSRVGTYQSTVTVTSASAP